MTEEKRGEQYRRQIDRIEAKLNNMYEILVGDDGKIGVYAKVDIMWGYRNIFVGLFTINLISLISMVILFLNGNSPTP